ncbi:hypothetical protein RHSIM_Rhsim06G0024400 [Rhododendron simsii]|uniref:Histone H2A n=1 Tax=Rhododendron simsii TaxID=118357 RepID=A0A834GW20_RHOSS|nr:hypothetical protein RHSIM_Rhsim06G0024400 [Rhododendron simsii]
MVGRNKVHNRLCRSGLATLLLCIFKILRKMKIDIVCAILNIMCECVSAMLEQLAEDRLIYICAGFGCAIVAIGFTIGEFSWTMKKKMRIGFLEFIGLIAAILQVIISGLQVLLNRKSPVGIPRGRWQRRSRRRLCFGWELGKGVVVKAVTVIGDGECEGRGKSLGSAAPKKATSRSSKAGLQLPIGRIAPFLKAGKYAERVGGGAPVYLAAVLEYVAAELSKLLGSVTIANGGLMPNIHAHLLPKKAGGASSSKVDDDNSGTK